MSKIKVCFISNFFNHHQKPFCDAMYFHLMNDFVFIATSYMSEERKALRYGMSNTPTYVKEFYSDTVTQKECQQYIDDSDVIIIGSAKPELVKTCIKQGKLIFRYSERLLKKTSDYLKLLWWMIKWQKYYSYSNVYLLCASAFTYKDFSRINFFKNRAFKWGYFPEAKNYNIEELIQKKDKYQIMWCGRFLDWKHPDDVIYMAKKLKDCGYEFQINLVGSGKFQNKIRELINEFKLDKEVKILGAMSPNEVRNKMEQASIFLCTSDFQEGWGAVLNEAMNSGCAVVSSHAMGAAPYLINDNINGLIYKSGSVDDLTEKVKELIDNPEKVKCLGREAYNTISELWNAEVATKRLFIMIDEIKKYRDCTLFDEGPCSKSELFLNNWF